jgi:hypothetical protein
MIDRIDDVQRAAVVDLQERLAESRHNEKLGWGAVFISAVLVMTLSLLSRIAVGGPAAAETGRTIVVVAPGGHVLMAGLDVVAGLFVLSAILVVLGVSVAVYCRFVRSRVYAQLRTALEPRE